MMKLDLRDLHLLTIKRTLYIANVNDDGFENNPISMRCGAIADQEGAEVVPVCAAIEAELAELDDAEKTEFLAEMGLESPGLDRVVRAGYQLLHLQTYFTAGVKEVRLDGAGRRHCAAGRRCHPYRFRAWIHPCRGHRL